METSNKHLEDISQIRQIMERSTKFLSLSGWSGVFAGLFAVLGAIAVYIYMGGAEINYNEQFRLLEVERAISPRIFLLLDAGAVLTLAIASALFFSYRKAKRVGEKFWSPVLRRLLVTLLIPLIAGGIMSVVLIWQDQVHLLAPLTLIFYGMAIIGASRYVNRELLILGFAEIALGEAAIIWPDLGLYFWAIGFGLLHMIYGVLVYFKYDRK